MQGLEGLRQTAGCCCNLRCVDRCVTEHETLLRVRLFGVGRRERHGHDLMASGRPGRHTIVHGWVADRAGNVQLWGIPGVQKEAVLAATRFSRS